MTALCLLLFAVQPCERQDAPDRILRHGPEEIRVYEQGRSLYLALRNLGQRPIHVDVVWRELGFRGTARVFDLAADKDQGKVHAGFARKLAPGACAGYRVEPPAGSR